jgi:dephospho-CoA kinase
MEETLPKLTERPEEPPPPEWSSDPEGLLKSRPGLIRAALTGGVASGKSTVAELLVAFGADLIDFDILARQVLKPDLPGWTKAVELFGPKMVNSDKTLNRAKIGALVFKKPDLRRKLEEIVHPQVWELMLKRLSELKESPLIIIDVPLLFETRINSLFSPVVLCFCTPVQQYQRLRARDPHKGRGLCKRTIKSQSPSAEKIRLSNYIINNSGSLPELIRQTKKVWLDLQANLSPEQ